jgi:lipoprotein NlpI
MSNSASTSEVMQSLQACSGAWERGHFEEIVRLTTEAIESGQLAGEEAAVAYYQRGLARSRQDLTAEATEDFAAAIKLSPGFAEAYYQRGYVYRNTGQDDKALDDYDRAINLAPGLVHAYINRGVIYVEKGLYYRALQDFHQAIRLDPSRARVYSDRGCAFYGNGHYSRAMQDFDEALRLDPNYAIAHLHRGHVYCIREKYDQAIDAYSQAIRLNPEFALAHKNRGHVYFYQGRFAEAAIDYDAFVKLEPKDTSVKVLLYLARMRSDQTEIAAAELLRQAQNLDLQEWPGAAVALYLNRANPENVIAQACADGGAGDGRDMVFFYVGQYFLIINRVAEAVEMFRQALLQGSQDRFEYIFSKSELRRLGVTVLVPRNADKGR